MGEKPVRPYLSGGTWWHRGHSARGNWAERARDASWPPRTEQPSQLP